MDIRCLSTERFNGISFFDRKLNTEITEDNSIHDELKVYQEDIQRVIYSSAFRRMQNKTQVHPLPDSDYLRNRLTHTLEVSEIGQLIATGVGRHLQRLKRLPASINPSDLKDIVATACLVHDIGNPPFGHSGEEAIQGWFQKNKDMPIISSVFSKYNNELDFLFFDGNAQGFRVVNRLQYWREAGGLRLSLAAIGASVKYPWSSADCMRIIGKKKFGFMAPDAGIFETIFQKLGLVREDGSYIRHPLSYIMEAADDIAYLTTDIEDGVKTGSIDYLEGFEALKGCVNSFHSKRLESIDERKKDDRISYLRSAAISTMSDAAFVAFVKESNYNSIIRGDFRGSLLDRTEFVDKIKVIRELCKKSLYNRTPKLQIEAAGHRIINFLMDTFMGMVNAVYMERTHSETLTRKDAHILALLPKEIRMNIDGDSEKDLVYRIVDYISGMTDTYSANLYSKLMGINIK